MTPLEWQFVVWLGQFTLGSAAFLIGLQLAARRWRARRKHDPKSHGRIASGFQRCSPTRLAQ